MLIFLRVKIQNFTFHVYDSSLCVYVCVCGGVCVCVREGGLHIFMLKKKHSKILTKYQKDSIQYG